MDKIVIIGAGGFGREVHWMIEELNRNQWKWDFLGYIDDNIPVGTIINGYPVIGNVEWLSDKKLNVVCAIAEPNSKKNVIEKLYLTSNLFPILIHPNVSISRFVDIGEGSIICSGAILTVNIKIGKYVLINVNSTIGHDSIIQDYSTILPSASISGNVILNERVIIGTGARILQGLIIGENSFIGAGAVVTKNVPNNVISLGIPAKTLKTRD
jgi:sugar O-acyltransferase (sialic acid O-acetyltransferase NeuD family)